MPLQAVRNRSLADEVFSQLMNEILRGHYQPGVNLPPERSMTQIFHVNRHVIREALKRLEQLGVVTISQGGGTRVLDYRQHGGIDLLPLLGQYLEGTPDGMLLWRSVLEMRAAIATDMVRLCAMRASVDVRSDLEIIAAELERTSAPQAIYDQEVKFWYRIADGCDNLAYRLALNGIVRGTAIDMDLCYRLIAWEVRAARYRIPLATFIAAGDVDRAEAEVRRTMRAALDAFYQRFVGSGAVSEAPRATLVEKPTL